MPHPQKRAGALLNRAMSYLDMGDYKSSIDDGNDAMKISRQLGDEVLVARAENGLGNAYRDLGRFSEAEAAFADALRIARENGQRLGEAFVLNNMSMLHETEGDYPTAIKFCEQSLAIKRELGTKFNIATSLINLADYYDLVKRDNDANRMLMEAAQIGREIKMKEITAKATTEMGVIELETPSSCGRKSQIAFRKAAMSGPTWRIRKASLRPSAIWRKPISISRTIRRA